MMQTPMPCTRVSWAVYRTAGRVPNYGSGLKCFKKRYRRMIRNWRRILPTVQTSVSLVPLGKTFADFGIDYTVLRQWCLTMFAEAMPLPTCLRAMDLVIAQGTPAILKLASVVILLCAKRLLVIANPADMMTYLRQPSQEWLSPENVIRNMGKIALPKKGL